MINTIVSYISLILAVVSLVYALRSQRENKDLKRLLNMERQHFSWEEIHKACRELATELRKFKPSIIVTTPGTPMMVASLIVEELHEWIPMHIIYVTDASVANCPNEFVPEDYIAFKSARRKWHMPRKLLGESNARIAIIDDVSFDSVYFDRLLELLTNDGKMTRENIFTASLIASQAVLHSRSLDWHRIPVVNTSIYLPWGEDRSLPSLSSKES